MSDASNQLARRVRYVGRVQGVGFRATAVSIARVFSVTGWVRNRANGSVELWAEGDATHVDRFLREVRAYWGDSIEREEAEDEQPAGHTRFEVHR